MAYLPSRNFDPDLDSTHAICGPLAYLFDSPWLALHDCIHISLGNLVVHFSQHLRTSSARGRSPGHAGRAILIFTFTIEL